MRPLGKAAIIFIACALIFVPVLAAAQTVPEAFSQPTNENAIKERKNAWTVGIVGGLFVGTFMRFAAEMAKVLNDGDEMRVIPMVSEGSVLNLEDLLYLRGVDVAVTQADAFEYFRDKRKVPNLNRRVQYILRLPLAEVHVIAGPGIRTIADLRGKKVQFASVGSASSLTGSIMFQRLGIKVQAVYGSVPGGVNQLLKGEVDAIVRVVGKPVGHVSHLPNNRGLHLISIPFSKKFTDYYAFSEFTHKDYPNLVPQGHPVDTIAVPSVLAVYNWPEDTVRYRRVERFIRRLFANWDKFQHPPFHPKWRDINLAATVPGWTRFSVAEEEVRKLVASNKNARIQRDFGRFVSELNARGVNVADSPKQRNQLFRQFIEWQKQH
jgi:TRAP transporter TAXI family solute receptor